jgi:hypothetical protein
MTPHDLLNEAVEIDPKLTPRVPTEFTDVE